MNIVNYKDINSALAADAPAYIKRCCEEYDEKCRSVAEHISERADQHPIILLAGPSGSGKTTTALKIESYLDKMGFETHTISMDDYFLPKDKIQIFDENNQIDYESPYRIDIELLQDHLHKLANCEPIDIPGFDFKLQDRVPGRRLERKPGELVLFEGIHALNPEVTGYEDIASCIYVSVRTRIQTSDGDLIHPEFIRVMRRIIRDNNFRGRSAPETLDMYDSVQRGENHYILPFKHRAHYHIDTFHGFEASLYKGYLDEEFKQLKESYPDYERYSPIEKLISELTCLEPQLIPENALVREFIGG
jgi:uridine kinase